MTPARWRRVEDLFDAAQKLDASEVDAFLRSQCGDDRDLAAEIAELLHHHQSNPGVLTPVGSPWAGLLRELAGAPTLVADQWVGPYRIVRLIGRGGMGEVFLAEDSRLQRFVALKVLSAWVSRESSPVQRFTQEALAVSALNHPNVPVVYEAGEIDGRHYIASEYVDGESLQERIARSPLDWRDAVAIALQIADALEAAHRIGVIHRDVKPGNILVCADGRAKLVDFGVAKIAEGSRRKVLASDPATALGLVIGTPGYMAPEQAAGKPLNERSDLWSLAAVVFEMVTGRKPATGMGKIRLGLAGPALLAGVLERGLAPDPQKRYSSASEFAAALRQARHSRFHGRHSIPWVASALFGTALAAVWGYRHFSAPTRVDPRPAIAVLSFKNMSGDAGNEYFSQGIQEEVLTHIAKISGLKVMSRHASAAFSSQPTSLQAVSAALRVDTVLEGSIQTQGDRMRVIVHLIDALNGADLWSESYDRQTKDIFDVERDIAERVADQLQATLLPAERTAVETPDTQRPESHKADLLGRYFMARRDDQSYRKAIEQFQEAVRIDPDYAMAYADLSLAAFDLADAMEEPRNLELKAQARMAAQRAVAIAPNLAEGHVALGWVLLFYDWNLVAAQHEFELAVQLAPNSARAKNGLATLEAKLGRLDSAIAWMSKARALDPLSSGFANNLANFLLAKGDYAGAEKLSREALELEPNVPVSHRNLAMIALHRGALDEAQREAEREPNQSFKEFSLTLVAQSRGTQATAIAALRAFIARHQQDDPFYVAEIYAARGDPENAFVWLDRAFQAHDTSTMDLLEVPMFAGLRSDPRFTALCNKLGIPAPVTS